MNSWFPTIRRLLNHQLSLPSWWPLSTSAGQSRSLLRLIAVALEENVPLTPLLERWAEDERGIQSRRIQRLVKLLKSGRALPDAVEEIPGILHDEDLLALRFDAQSGTRTAAVRQTLADTAPETAGQTPRVRRVLVYFCIVVPIALFIFVFLQLKIVPVLLRMMQEFAVPQPPVLHWSSQLVSLFFQYWWLEAAAVLALVWSMFSTRGGRFFRHSVFGRLFQPLRELFAADVLEKLGLALGAGRPLAGALSTLARYHFVPAIRHKLLFVRNEVEQGAEAWQSLAAVGLITPPELRLLKTADRLGNRAWVLRKLSQTKRRRTRRRLERAAELVLPSLVILFGSLVLFQALTVFQPLTQLIESLL